MNALAGDLLKALDPVETAAVAGMDPDPWQAEALRSTSARMLWLVSRQAGKSTTAALLAVHHALYTPESTVLLVSPSQRQSGELLLKVKAHARRMGRPEEGGASTLVLDNGSRILSLPGESSTVRGFTPSLIVVDEASRVSDELYVSIRPMLAVSGGRLLALSTPAGRRGWFWSAWDAADQGVETWDRVRVPATECPRISDAFLAEERRSLGEWMFRQEYLCEFVDDLESFWRTEWIENARTATGALWPEGVVL